MKRVFLVHGWDGYPENNWFPWLRKELEKRDFKVYILAMPDPDSPKIERWVPFLEEQIKNVDESTFLVGHSIGCQTILRYLERLPQNKKVGGVIFVAGWVSLTPMAIRSKEEQKIVKPWFETPIDFENVKKSSNRFVAIFSDDDPYVPLSKNLETYREKLDAKIIIEKGKGHFSDEEGIKELPIALNKLLEIAR